MLTPRSPTENATRRLRAVDGAVIGLFSAAYACNLVATPLDDQLSYEWARDPRFWQQLPGFKAATPAFGPRLALWHAANLARAAACGAAWALVCYRSSPRVVGAVLEERRARSEREAGGMAGPGAAAVGRLGSLGGGGGGVMGYGSDGALPPIAAG